MEQQQTTESTPQQTEPNSSSSSTLPPPQSSSSPNSNPNLPQNPNPNPNPNSTTIARPPSLQPQPHPQQQQISQSRPPFNNRPWQQQQQQSSSASSSVSPFSHFGASSPSVSASASPVPLPVQRGGVAIGVPAAAQSAPFSALNSSSYGQQQQQYAGLGRNVINVPDSVASPSSPQVRQPIQGYQGTGMIGSFGTGSLVRPGSVSTLHQSRPIQPSVRPQSTPTNQAGATQNFQGHALLRTSSIGSPASPSPNTSQNTTSHNQPWLSSGPQGKPPLPSPSFRPQMNQLGQGSHLPQNHQNSIPPASQQQKGPSSQQLQPSSQTNQNEVSGKQYVAPFRATQNLPTQHHITRVQGAGNQKPSTLANVQPGETCNRLLSKRSIHELLNQIDPSENLDPEVEDILVDIADDFVESITTFGCSLAKHRKSSTLEAKDILLHLERNWNLTLPGFSGDEIKTYKKPISNDIHKERLAAIKKSLVGNEMTNTKPSGGQAAQKGHLVKAPANTMES